MANNFTLTASSIRPFSQSNVAIGQAKGKSEVILRGKIRHDSEKESFTVCFKLVTKTTLPRS